VTLPGEAPEREADPEPVSPEPAKREEQEPQPVREPPAKQGGATPYIATGLLGIALGAILIKFAPRLRPVISKWRNRAHEA
jgi:hypothetical protein